MNDDNNYIKIQLTEVTLPSDKVDRKYNNKKDKYSVSIKEENIDSLYSTTKNKKYSTPINFGSDKTKSINDLQEHTVKSTYRYIECDSNIDDVNNDIYHDHSKKLNKTYAYKHVTLIETYIILIYYKKSNLVRPS